MADRIVQPGSTGGRPPPAAEPDRLPRWPARLQELCARLPHPGTCAPPPPLRSEIWLLLHAALSGYLHRHAIRLGGVPAEDLEDLAAEKSLDLLRRCEQGMWSLEGREPGEIVVYLSHVARNGLLDLQRRVHRRFQAEPEDEGESPWDRPAARNPGPDVEAPDTGVERRDFARALRSCAEHLNPRDRRIWFFRIFYEMSSKEIAAHPEVSLKASHVDVLLQRCRQAIRTCLARQGYAPGDMPRGVFGELWRAFRASGRDPGGRDSRDD
jgi:RNA polymerase sigma factor (sigma-70 family)